MRKFKHSKYKNTGIIFNLLSRQVASDVLTNTDNSSLKIIKTYFKEGTEIRKELSCYRILAEQRNKKEASASKLLDLVLEQRNKINVVKLNKEKYRLIKDIRANYLLEAFFDARIPEYKLYASIYKLFEFNSSDNPQGHINCYDTILEHLTGNGAPKTSMQESTSLLSQQTPEVTKLAFKMIVEKFNTKYSPLNPRQRKLLTRFINEDTSSVPFKNYIHNEVSDIQKELKELTKTLSNKVTKIKLDESIKLMSEITSAKRLKDEHLSAILKYYELIDLIKEK